MPLYGFECSRCKHQFEEFLASSEINRLFCPECHGEAKKIMPAPMDVVKVNYTAANGYSIVKGDGNARIPK
jgi:putative FmdB family regulatory protein